MSARRLHPELWLGHTADRLHARSRDRLMPDDARPALRTRSRWGSLSVSADSDAAVADLDRFLGQLIAGPLEPVRNVTGTPYWERWEELKTRHAKEQRDLADELSQPLGLPDPRLD